MAVLETHEKHQELIDELIADVSAYNAEVDRDLLRRAFLFAANAHEGQQRRSGEDFVLHPWGVAKICAQLRLDDETIAAALLHDVVEDTDVDLEEVRSEFGDEIAKLVEGVTKLTRVQFQSREQAEAENYRKLIVAMAADVRVILIKLADRLHNLREIEYLGKQKQIQKAKETLEVYAPLAHRLGIHAMKWELEDLAFETLHPRKYEEIKAMVSERRADREGHVAEAARVLQLELGKVDIPTEISGRAKHFYSIYDKMAKKGREFNEIFDLTAMRVIVGSVKDCYGAIGVIHSLWKPLPGRFKDFIAMPKFNMYQSLHTTVIGPGGKPVELQIRTQNMHRTAEFGIAAHWKYKEAGAAPATPAAVSDEMGWLRQLLDWQREAQEPGEFLETLRFDLGAQEVYVFTPKGDVIGLPVGSTAVDFAYAVHTDVGHRCIGARVSGKLVALETKLDNGDTIEIFTSKAEGAGPSRDWLAFVASPRAKTKIRQWFAKERREDAVEAGKTALTRSMRKSALPLQRLLGGDQLLNIARDMHLNDVTALYVAIGEGHVSAQSIVQKLVASLGGVEGATEDLAETAIPTRSQPQSRRSGGNAGVMVAGMSDVWVKLARCCTPVPGDEILGFITRGGGVSVHRQTCTNAEALQQQSERLVDVEWAPSSDSVFVVSIQVEALDRHRLLSDVSRVLSDERVNILSASVSTNRDRVAVSRFTFELAEAKHLGHLLRTVRGVEGVYDVYRVSAN